MTAEACDPPEYDTVERTERHVLADDPQDPENCLVCGDVYGWGFAHLEPPAALDFDVPAPEGCRGCSHYVHPSRPCDGAYPGGVPCRCGSAA